MFAQALGLAELMAQPAPIGWTAQPLCWLSGMRHWAVVAVWVTACSCLSRWLPCRLGLCPLASLWFALLPLAQVLRSH